MSCVFSVVVRPLLLDGLEEQTIQTTTASQTSKTSLHKPRPTPPSIIAVISLRRLLLVVSPLRTVAGLLLGVVSHRRLLGLIVAALLWGTVGAGGGVAWLSVWAGGLGRVVVVGWLGWLRGGGVVGGGLVVFVRHFEVGGIGGVGMR